MTENTHLQTEATTLVKTFGKPSRPSPESSKISDINLPQLQLNGNKIDILIGMFDQEGVIASKEVKESLAVIVLESAKALQMDIDEIINDESTNGTAINFNKLRNSFPNGEIHSLVKLVNP